MQHDIKGFAPLCPPPPLPPLRVERTDTPGGNFTRGSPPRLHGTVYSASYEGLLWVRSSKHSAPADSVKRNAAGPMPLISLTRTCDRIAPKKYSRRPIPAATPAGDHQIPRTNP